MTPPEIKIARRFSKSQGLTPPVDIRAIVEQFAEIEETVLPVKADAISLHLKDPNRKPHIIINRFTDESRKKFTLAHELAHIIIPWHVGTVISHLSGYQHFNDHIYQQIEAEANRFAKEILLPLEWLQVRMAKFDGSASRMAQTVSKKAKVSILATAISLLEVLPSGFVFASLDSDGSVQTTGRSSGTAAIAPNRGERITDASLHFPMASNIEIFEAGFNTLVWWQFGQVAKLSSTGDGADWHTILNGIFEDLRMTGEEKRNYIQKISGVIGAANSKHKHVEPEALCSVIQQRLSSKPEYRNIAQHGNCMKFIRARVLSMKELD